MVDKCLQGRQGERRGLVRKVLALRQGSDGHMQEGASGVRGAAFSGRVSASGARHARPWWHAAPDAFAQCNTI